MRFLSSVADLEVVLLLATVPQIPQAYWFVRDGRTVRAGLFVVVIDNAKLTAVAGKVRDMLVEVVKNA